MADGAGVVDGRKVTTGELISIIWREYVASGMADLSCDGQILRTELIARGRRKGWLEEEDELFYDRPIERRAAARIVHEFLRKECAEQDRENWEKARGLKDLFDCRVCVGHVSQVYVKGIMEASGDIFGMRELIGPDEAVLIAERMFRTNRRLFLSEGSGEISESETEPEHICVKPECITEAEISVLIKEYDAVAFVDVRSAAEYERGYPTGDANLPGAAGLHEVLNRSKVLRLPMAKILEQPDCVGESRDTCLILFCDRGYQSQIAANCLAEAGYEKVYYLGVSKE